MDGLRSGVENATRRRKTEDLAVGRSGALPGRAVLEKLWKQKAGRTAA